ncbi:MAG: NAD(P)H-binding protein [Neisseria sp.]|nr:NAD(P)H-binding protein [Neisseria sp.]
MKIAVIGATGLVGAAVVRELAKRGHEVTAFARNTEKIEKAANIRAVAADVNDARFAGQLAGFDTVVSAFNPGWDNPNYAADFERGYQSILNAAQQASVPYLLVIGGAGSLYVAPGLQLVDTPDFPPEVYPGADAARRLLNQLTPRRDLNWGFLSPAAMFAVNPPRFEGSGTYRIGGNDVLLDSQGRPADISVPDLAAAIADEAQSKAHLFQRFTVAE